MYKFTIFTPCYNSEKFIHRVYESLCAQTFRDFEWLVIDDASSDRTPELLNEYKMKASFPMRIITNKENKMLYYNMNLAFDLAQGELMTFSGHDDAFEPNTLEKLNEIWNQYGNDNIAGIWTRTRDQHGNIIGSKFPEDILISDYHSIFEKYIYGNQERFPCMRVDVLKKYKFDLNSDRIGESFLWSDIGIRYKTIFINDVLRIYYIEPENKNALTKSGRKKYAQNTLQYYIDFLNIYIRYVPDAYVLKLRFHFATVFYSLIAGYSLGKLIKKINYPVSVFLIIIFYTPAYVLYFRLKKNKN